MGNEIYDEKRDAKHGQFFFAKFKIGDYSRTSPIFVLSNECDKNDDVIVCLCTTKGPKSEFDVRIHLKEETYVRTNKIHTISRQHLLFKIDHVFAEGEYETIRSKLSKALALADE